jgi:hypothetical protein
MSARIGHHIRSNIIGYVCLFWLMTGTAYAAVIVHSNGEVARDTIAGHNPPTGDHSNLIAGSVDTTDLAGRSVGAPKLAADAVTGPKVADNSLTGADIDESSLVGVQKGASTDEIGHKLLAPGIGNFSTGVLIGFQDGELVAYCQVDADGTTVGGLQVGDDTGATGPLMVSLSVFQEPSSGVISNETDVDPSTTTGLFGTTQADSHSEVLTADRFPASDTSFRLARMSAQIKVNQGAHACRFWGEGSVYG